MTNYLNITNTVKMPKDRYRKCLVCNQEFKTDRFTYICHNCKNIESRDEMRMNTRIGRIINN